MKNALHVVGVAKCGMKIVVLENVEQFKGNHMFPNNELRSIQVCKGGDEWYSCLECKKRVLTQMRLFI